MRKQFIRTALIAIVIIFGLTTINAQDTQTPNAEHTSQTTELLIENNQENKTLSPALEKKALALIEQVASDASLLKLPENRIVVQVAVADLFWLRDEKRARILFGNAAAELNAAFDQLNNGDAADGDNAFYSLYAHREKLIGKTELRDPELALELLRQTRPIMFQAFMETEEASSEMIAYYTKCEANTEQNIATQIAAKNPRRALQLARESLAQNLSPETFGLIDKLQEVDAQAASEFAAEVARKLLSMRPEREQEYEQRTLIRDFLSRYATKPFVENRTENSGASSQLLLSEKGQRDLAEKVVAMYFDARYNEISADELGTILPIVEKFVAPERVIKLRQKQTAIKQYQGTPYQQSQREQQLSQLLEKGSPEQMLAGVGNFPPEMQNRIYATAAERISSSGDSQRARQTLGLITKKQLRLQALSSFDSQRASAAISEEKLDEARQLVPDIALRNQKIQSMIELARGYYAKKNSTVALQLLEETRSMINATPESEDEVNEFMQLSAAYAVVAPEKAFALVEPVIYQKNELIAAEALIAKFNKQSSVFRQGEIVYEYSSSVASFLSQDDSLVLLATADFERTQNLINVLERNDMRLLARLMVAQMILTGSQSVISSDGGGC